MENSTGAGSEGEDYNGVRDGGKQLMAIRGKRQYEEEVHKYEYTKGGLIMITDENAGRWNTAGHVYRIARQCSTL